MKKLVLNGILASAFLMPFAFAEDAEAREYCREYTKTIRVNGHKESGYGTACMQPDGSWMIVDSRGNVDPFDELRRQNVTIVADQRPVYYNYGPYYRPITYYAPRRHYRQPQGIFFSYGWGRDGWNHHDRWDRDHDRDRHHRGRNRH